MLEYKAGVYASVYATGLGQDLWVFLNEPDGVLMMTTATALGRPAVEGIEEALLARFGQGILDFRVKQMCGHMARQVMEAQGYRVSVQNTKIANGAPFVRGTKYQRRDEVMMHSFRNSRDSRLFALTADKNGSGLPEGQGSWSYYQPVKGALRISVLTMAKVGAVIAAIEKDGYFPYRLERITRPAV
ncbi:MAG TPA: hypothetical protein VEX35_14365 [Allosphingosinicella sp.]|nr:hypothetical protein [Allosphingosinicella sp.]